jgi:hypothetical protein
MEGCSIVISNTKKPRSLADSKYNERRAQCEQGLSIMKAALPEINYLCEITPAQLEENIQLITDEVIAKRIRHCVYEEDRVRQSMEVLHKGDIEAFGKLLCESHESLRDLYEVTGKELDTLVEAGYQPESAYFECMHEMKLIVDLMYEGGISNMRYSVSDTAQYGDLMIGRRIITEDTRAEMKQVLSEIQTGEFAREWLLENQVNRPVFNALTRIDEEHPIEKVGKELRSMMPWLKNKK